MLTLLSSRAIQRQISSSCLFKMNFSTENAKADVSHDTHARPPLFVQEVQWHYQRVKRQDLDDDLQVIDFGRGLTESQRESLVVVDTIPAATIKAACDEFETAVSGGKDSKTRPLEFQQTPPEGDVTVYEHRDFPGLRILPGLVPPRTQLLYTSQLMHTYLANPAHTINLQEDYDVPYIPSGSASMDNLDLPSSSSSSTFKSLFNHPQSSQDARALPKNADTHKPLYAAQFLSKKLRWLTLGTQYHWPTRSYDKNCPTSFPSDIGKLVSGFFPHIHPESGVVLIYSAKDFMPVHRDVSEQCNTPLASFSLGCDGIFVLAKGEDDGQDDQAPQTVAIRVKSGDCLHLFGQARWAWHAMARTLPGTCPDFLAPWPVGTPGATAQEQKAYEKWKGFMSGKRINISCRQVWD